MNLTVILLIFISLMLMITAIDINYAKRFHDNYIEEINNSNCTKISSDLKNDIKRKFSDGKVEVKSFINNYVENPRFNYFFKKCLSNFNLKVNGKSKIKFLFIFIFI